MMRQFLVHTQGIPRKHIWMDNTSKNTVGNIRHLRALCRLHRVRRLTLITSAWHLPRVRTLCAHLLQPRIQARLVGSKDKVSSAWKRREGRKHQVLLRALKHTGGI